MSEVTGENSAHDHGNCELCDYIDGQLAALRAKKEPNMTQEQITATARRIVMNLGYQPTNEKAMHATENEIRRFGEAITGQPAPLREITHD